MEQATVTMTLTTREAHYVRLYREMSDIGRGMVGRTMRYLQMDMIQHRRKDSHKKLKSKYFKKYARKGV